MTIRPNSPSFIQFESDRFTLSGLGWQSTSPQRPGLVCCNGLGEESKSSHRSLFHLGRQLQQYDFSALLFDYVGSGDSAGQDTDGNLRRWQTNVEDAVRKLVELADVDPVVLLGVRLGGWVALQAAQALSIDTVVLWSPLLDLPGYAHSLELQQHMIEITLGLQSKSLERSSAGLDFGGIFLSSEMLVQMQQASLPVNSSGTILYLEPNTRGKFSLEATEQIHTLQTAGYEVESRIVVDEPLHAQSLSPERPNLVTETVNWMQTRYAKNG